MLKLTSLQKDVYSLLPKGASRPRPQSEITRLLGIDKRTVSAIINELIVKHGIPIGSNRYEPTGYYLIENAEELQKAVQPLVKQAQAETERINTLLQIDLNDFYAKEKADN